MYKQKKKLRKIKKITNKQKETKTKETHKLKNRLSNKQKE